MTSFIRISDIPLDELHLLPVIGLRQQIREDRNRLSSPSSRIDQGEADGSPLGRAHHADVPAAQVWRAIEESFVTDWQLQDEPGPIWRSAVDRKGIDGDEEHGGEDFEAEGFEDEDEDAGEEEERYDAGENHDPGEDADALYVDIGGEG